MTSKPQLVLSPGKTNQERQAVTQEAKEHLDWEYLDRALLDRVRLNAQQQFPARKEKISSLHGWTLEKASLHTYDSNGKETGQVSFTLQNINDTLILTREITFTNPFLTPYKLVTEHPNTASSHNGRTFSTDEINRSYMRYKTSWYDRCNKNLPWQQRFYIEKTGSWKIPEEPYLQDRKAQAIRVSKIKAVIKKSVEGYWECSLYVRYIFKTRPLLKYVDHKEYDIMEGTDIYASSKEQLCECLTDTPLLTSIMHNYQILRPTITQIAAEITEDNSCI